MNWRLVNGSVIGTSHVESGALCQDVSLAGIIPSGSGESVLVAVASDGAGSAPLSHVGAAIACSVVYEKLKYFVSTSTEAVDFAAFEHERLLHELRLAIEERAEIDGTSARDFACTLLLAAVGEASSLFLQIGDGAIVVGSGTARRIVFWPEAGEYANMTYFVTDESASGHLHASVVPDTVSEVAVFTDGLQRLALRYDERRAHEPFFAPLFQNLRQWAGTQDALTSALVTWMESDTVNERTDDDKTLVLAVRVANASQESTNGNPL